MSISTLFKAVVFCTAACGILASGAALVVVHLSRVVNQGKGQKDRYVMLSPKLLETLRGYWRVVRPSGGWLFEGDIANQPINRSSVELACQKARHRRDLLVPGNNAGTAERYRCRF